MGGGTSFSAGGPGKGMYTRLYQNILNRFPYVQASPLPSCILPRPPLLRPPSSSPPHPPFLSTPLTLPLSLPSHPPLAQAASVFNAFYNDTGVFGVYGAAPPSEMGALVAGVIDELKKMKGDITDVELSRAKNQLKASLLMNLESRPILFEDVGRQVLTYGARTEPETLLKQIDAVSVKDLQKVATAMLKTAPSLVVVGDTTSVPRYDLIAKALA